MTKLLQQCLDALLPHSSSHGNSWRSVEDAAIEALKQALAQQEPRCQYCDGTGDVHSPDGQWRGECHCKAQQEQPASVDAYVGAREDAAIWKKRALEAEELNRKFIADVNGPTYLGEPVKQEQPAQEPFKWYDGAPPFPQNQESFIAQTIYGERVVLRVLPEEYTYDYTTADGTHMKAENIKKWMQFPDCEFLPPEPAPTQPALSDDGFYKIIRPFYGTDESCKMALLLSIDEFRAIEAHCRGGAGK